MLQLHKTICCCLLTSKSCSLKRSVSTICLSYTCSCTTGEMHSSSDDKTRSLQQILVDELWTLKACCTKATKWKCCITCTLEHDQRSEKSDHWACCMNQRKLISKLCITFNSVIIHSGNLNTVITLNKAMSSSQNQLNIQITNLMQRVTVLKAKCCTIIIWEEILNVYILNR